jgi:hypothetical protein
MIILNLVWWDAFTAADINEAFTGYRPRQFFKNHQRLIYWTKFPTIKLLSARMLFELTFYSLCWQYVGLLNCGSYKDNSSLKKQNIKK